MTYHIVRIERVEDGYYISAIDLHWSEELPKRTSVQKNVDDVMKKVNDFLKESEQQENDKKRGV